MIKKPFDINEMTLTKFGWVPTNIAGAEVPELLPYNAIWFFEIKNTRETITYYIAEIIIDRNITPFQTITQNVSIYRFKSFRTQNKNNPIISFERRMLDDTEVLSNAELFKIIIETGAFTDDYARNFKINKLLKR